MSANNIGRSKHFRDKIVAARSMVCAPKQIGPPERFQRADEI
jgi:hypothetical protein